MINYQLTVSGQVQGVGFRWGCYRLAQQYGVSGFVKKLPSGQVYLEVQLLPSAVTNFIARVETGPTPYAHVNQVSKHRLPCQDYGGQFTIRR